MTDNKTGANEQLLIFFATYFFLLIKSNQHHTFKATINLLFISRAK